MPILLMLLSIKPFVFFIFTFIVAHIFLYDMYKDRIIHMNDFYGNDNKKLTSKNRVHIEFNIFIISLSSLILVCPLKYHLIIIVLIFIMFFVTLVLTKIYFKNKSIYDVSQIRKYYFKFSIIIGLIYSVLLGILDNTTSILSAGRDASNGNICGAITLLNDLIQKVISFLPSPLDTLFSMLISVQIVSGFVFTLFILVFLRLKQNSKDTKLELND